MKVLDKSDYELKTIKHSIKIDLEKEDIDDFKKIQEKYNKFDKYKDYEYDKKLDDEAAILLTKKIEKLSIKANEANKDDYIEENGCIYIKDRSIKFDENLNKTVDVEYFEIDYVLLDKKELLSMNKQCFEGQKEIENIKRKIQVSKDKAEINKLKSKEKEIKQKLTKLRKDLDIKIKENIMVKAPESRDVNEKIIDDIVYVKAKVVNKESIQLKISEDNIDVYINAEKIPKDRIKRQKGNYFIDVRKPKLLSNVFLSFGRK